jgi:hypothetical protein
VLYNPRLPSLSSFRPSRRAWFAALGLAAGCSSGNRPEIGEAGVSNLCIQSVCTPDVNGVCQHTCSPDPGPALVDCSTPEQNFLFMAPSLWTFEPADGGNAGMGLARGMYSYTDNSTTIATFKQIDNQTGLPVAKTWEPPTAVLPRCWDPNDHTKSLDPNNHAIHIQGGPFLSWGGGAGIGMKNFPSVTGIVATPEEAQLDVTGWEGISFWARRGPDSQVGFRVLIGDATTDDDIAYIMYRNDPTAKLNCQRVRECGCLNHRSCVAVHLDRPNGTGDIANPLIPTGCQLATDHLLDDQFMSFCGTPEVVNGAASSQAGGSQCNTCVETRCNERWPAYPDDYATIGGAAAPGIPHGSDLQFYGKPCSPYTMLNGISGFWCFDPAKGEKPAEATAQCGDHWTRVVNLSNEWQFYTIPFDQMAQQGWAQRSGSLDLKTVSVVRFTWDGGYIDYWIDDVRFYRHKPPPAPP